MIIKVTAQVFMDCFKAHLEKYKGTKHEVYFSQKGIKNLFSHLDGDEQNRNAELNVGYLCFVYKEYKTFKEIQDEYFELELTSLDELRLHTEVLEFDGGIIIKTM